jgi:hypothetical protein
LSGREKSALLEHTQLVDEIEVAGLAVEILFQKDVVAQAIAHARKFGRSGGGEDMLHRHFRRVQIEREVITTRS